MLRCTSSAAVNSRVTALRSARRLAASGLRQGDAGWNSGRLPARSRRSCAAAAFASHGVDTAVDARRGAHSSVHPSLSSCKNRTLLPPGLVGQSAATHALAASGSNVNLPFKSGAARSHARQLSTRRGLPPGRSLPEKIFAGMVVLLLGAWGLLFGAIALLLLPFIGIGLFLLRRNFQRGGMSRNIIAGLSRKMAERGGGGGGAGGFGPMMGSGGAGKGGVPWMQRAPTEGVLSSLLGRMLGGGIRGMELVGVLRSEVEKRALRHPGLSSALGGGIESFTDVEMSTVGSVGGTFSPGPGSSRGRGGGGGGKGPSRVTKAKLRFSGRRGRGRGAGWAEVQVTDWGGGEGEEGGMEFDRVFVTLDNGRTFDLTSDSFAEDGDAGADGLHEEKASSQFFRRPNKSSSSGSSGSSSGVGRRPAGERKDSRSRGASKTTVKGTTIEAEFRDK